VRYLGDLAGRTFRSMCECVPRGLRERARECGLVRALERVRGRFCGRPIIGSDLDSRWTVGREGCARERDAR